MSCDKYRYDSELIYFSEMDDDDTVCLCTFPYNDKAGGGIDLNRIKSLAYLGAAIKLVHDGELEGPVSIPRDLPEWIINQINMQLKEKY